MEQNAINMSNIAITLVSHEELLERAKNIKILLPVHTGHQTIHPSWAPQGKGYVLVDRTIDGKCEWYKPVY